jgi:hypothetical protein
MLISPSLLQSILRNITLYLPEGYELIARTRTEDIHQYCVLFKVFKVLNIAELNHLIYAAAIVIRKKINGTTEFKIKAQRSKPPPWVRCIQRSINNIRNELTVLLEIKEITERYRT